MLICSVYVCKTTIWSSPGDMFCRKKDGIFKELPNVFVMPEDISHVGNEDDGTEDYRILRVVLKFHIKENLKLNNQNSLQVCQQPHSLVR